MTVADTCVVLRTTRLCAAARFVRAFGDMICEPDFKYSSGENGRSPAVEQLQALAGEHADSTSGVGA